jgi:hypothetical protein
MDFTAKLAELKRKKINDHGESSKKKKGKVLLTYFIIRVFKLKTIHFFS